VRTSILARPGGYTFVELLVAMAVVVVLTGIGMPVLGRAIENYRVGMAIRDVERDLQTARMKAVSSNHPIRVRFNCPFAGFYRVVELIGEAGAPVVEDDRSERCSSALYPFPAADLDPLTRPNHDGPLHQLPSNVKFGVTQTLEFWPDGSVHTGSESIASPWPVVAPTGIRISVQQGANTSAVVVNGIGRVAIVR
jgi:prepilin-type N-terminal cleavage/methylation domain-containing protein